MTKTIAQRELRNDNARVIDEVESGETFVVTRNGVPVAELRPIQRPRRSLVRKSDVLTLGAAGSKIDRAQFMADLDHVVEQGL